jgi:hypothetical protein
LIAANLLYMITWREIKVRHEPRYDRWVCAATLFVAGAPGERGIATLRPRLTACTVAAVFDAAPIGKISANKIAAKKVHPLL